MYNNVTVAGSPWKLPGCHCQGTTTSRQTTLWRRRFIEWGSVARPPALRTRPTPTAPTSCTRNTGLWLRSTSTKEWRDQTISKREKGKQLAKSLDLVNVCLHLLRVYKYFRYSYIYSPLYLINRGGIIGRNLVKSDGSWEKS